MGFFSCNKDGGRSDVARTVDLPIFDTAECATLVDTEYALCAGYIGRNRGVCSVSVAYVFLIFIYLQTQKIKL